MADEQGKAAGPRRLGTCLICEEPQSERHLWHCVDRDPVEYIRPAEYHLRLDHFAAVIRAEHAEATAHGHATALRAAEERAAALAERNAAQVRQIEGIEKLIDKAEVRQEEAEERAAALERERDAARAALTAETANANAYARERDELKERNAAQIRMIEFADKCTDKAEDRQDAADERARSAEAKLAAVLDAADARAWEAAYAWITECRSKLASRCDMQTLGRADEACHLAQRLRTLAAEGGQP